MPMRSVQDTTIGFEIIAMVWIHPALSETFFATNCERIAGDANLGTCGMLRSTSSSPPPVFSEKAALDNQLVTT
jgi:hypothetical protein